MPGPGWPNRTGNTAGGTIGRLWVSDQDPYDFAAISCRNPGGPGQLLSRRRGCRNPYHRCGSTHQFGLFDRLAVGDRNDNDQSDVRIQIDVAVIRDNDLQKT